MGFVKKYSKEIFIAAGLIILFFSSRIFHILTMPIFTDEAIYIRWAQIAKDDAGWRFISLTDGKQPLFIWLTMILMKFIHDPLLAGRLVSVGSGFITMIGLFFLSMELFKNKWIGILSGFMYFIFPMALVYDRMALYDSLVGAFAIWGLYIAILLIRKLRLDIALILGMVTGAAALNKTNGFFTLYLLPFSLLLFDWRHKERKGRFIKWLGLVLIVSLLTFLFYSVLRLSPFFHIINEKNSIFVYPFREWIEHPLAYFLSNLAIAQWDWFITYVTWPVLILILVSFFINKVYLKEKLLLFAWFMAPFVALALFGKTIYPRFIFFMILSLLPLAAYTLVIFFQKIKNKLFYAILFLFSILFVARIDFLILTDFKSAPLPFSDLNQYNNDWPAGGGIRESITFFKELSKKQKIYVGTEGTFGLMPSAYEIYLKDDSNIILKGFWPIPETTPQEVLSISKKMPTFFVFYQKCTACPDKGHAPSGWRITATPVLEITKPSGNAYLTVYQIKSQ